MSVSQSAAYEALRTSYGGSDSTRPSSLRPAYVKFNSLAKAFDFGTVESLVAELSGNVGSETGAATLFYKVELQDPADIRVVRNLINSKTDPYIAVSVQDSERKPIAIDELGFGYLNDIHNTAADESLSKLPRGLYYVTITSSQWQSIPFSVTLSVIKYTLVSGAATGSAPLTARLPLRKIRGAATGSAPSAATLRSPVLIKRLNGASTGTAQPSLTLVIMKGAAVGTMSPYGRIQMNWRLAGIAGGAASPVATLSSEAPYGGGY